MKQQCYTLLYRIHVYIYTDMREVGKENDSGGGVFFTKEERTCSTVL
jgi:hypothetical protein